MASTGKTSETLFICVLAQSSFIILKHPAYNVWALPAEPGPVLVGISHNVFFRHQLRCETNHVSCGPKRALYLNHISSSRSFWILYINPDGKEASIVVSSVKLYSVSNCCGQSFSTSNELCKHKVWQKNTSFKKLPLQIQRDGSDSRLFFSQTCHHWGIQTQSSLVSDFTPGFFILFLS